MTTPTSETELTQPFNQAFEKIKEGIRQAIEKFNALVDKIRDNWWKIGLLGPWIAWKIKEGLEKLQGALEKLAEKVQYALEHQTPVLSLIISSFKWISQVQTPVSEVSPLVNRPANENLAKWTGDANRSYRLYKLPEQKGAVDEMVASAKFMSEWLYKIAKGNIDYAIKMAELVSDFVERIVALVTKAATVVGIAEAAGELGDLAGEVIDTGFKLLSEIAKKLVDAIGDVRDLWGQVGDHSKLPGGKWPEAVRG